MATKTRRFEGQPADTAATAANLDAVAGNRPTTVTTSGTGAAKFTAHSVYAGSRALRISATATGFTWYTRDNGFNSKSISVYQAFMFDALPGAAIDFINVRDTASATVCGIGMNASGQVQVKDKSATVVTWSGTPVQAGTWYLVKVSFVQDASAPSTNNATITASLIVGKDPSVTPAQSYTSAVRNLGTVNLDAVWIGKLGSAVYDMTLDDTVVNDSSTAVGPPAYVAPSANAGADQVNREAWTSIQVDGSGSTGGSSSITAYAWSITPAGPTISNANIVNPTIYFPGTLTDQTYTVTLTVGDGTSTSSDTMLVGLLATPYSVYVSGTETPAEWAVL